MAAPVSSSNECIRPLLDAVDRLRLLNFMKEGIQLPTIVVVGDQSSGKSSVLESIAGISLPRGQSICTRVPLIMRLRNDPSADDPLLHLEYQGSVVHTSESDVTDAISLATTVITGANKGIFDVPLTLIVKKKGIPDLTMVDLPSIIRIPVGGEPENIYQQISEIIMKYIAPKESIILNVLSACVDFPTCESIQMSQRVDKSGERTFAVVTKADNRLDYLCMRNRLGNETCEEARKEEAKSPAWTSFWEDPFLSSMEKSSVSVRILAQKLTQIQAASITKYLPDISKQIDEKLNHNIAELEKMPENLSTKADGMRAVKRILSSAKESLTKLLVCGDFEEFPDDKEMKASIQISDMHDAYFQKLSEWPVSKCEFLMEEIDVLKGTKGVGLPGFSRSAFCTILKRNLKSIASSNHQFVVGLWDYVEEVVSRVLLIRTQNFSQLQSSITMAAQNAIDKMRRRCVATVKEKIEMEMSVDYTSDPDYTKTYELIMRPESYGVFKTALKDNRTPTVTLNVLGKAAIAHLRPYGDLAELAFVLRARLVAYWKCVVLRLADGMMVEILYSIKCLVEKDIEEEIMSNPVVEAAAGLGGSRAISAKRESLLESIELLKESKGVLASIFNA